MRCGVLLFFISSTAAAQTRPDSTWRDHNAAADSAAAHSRWRDYLYHARILDSALNRSSRVTIALARGYANAGQSDSALALLRDFAASGLTSKLDDDPRFAPLRSRSEFTEVLRQIVANGKT